MTVAYREVNMQTVVDGQHRVAGLARMLADSVSPGPSMVKPH
jgi:hypothetical protein